MDTNLKPLLNVVIVTNGKSPHFQKCLAAWIETGQFTLGVDLYVCGPVETLLNLQLPQVAVIDFADEPHLGRNFRINAKKLAACNAVTAEYVYLVHDRFIPDPNFRDVVELALASREVDFGAVDVFNTDDSLALGKLCLSSHCLSGSVHDVLEPVGRLIVTDEAPEATGKVAVNGGQFFLRRSLMAFLEAPLRWGEMEDDVLSFDLRNNRGCWIKGTKLRTLVARIPPVKDRTFGTRAKYRTYSFACNAAAILYRILSWRHQVTSVGEKIRSAELDQLITTGLLLIDPLHKNFASDYLPSTLEKLTVRARLKSGGAAWHRIDRKWFGWQLN